MDKDKKQKFRKEETTVNQTESEQTNDEPSDEIVEGLEVTSNNLGRSFDLTSAESYYLSQQEHIQGQLTCVGTVQTKGQSLATAQCLFDICSTDSWVLTSFAEQIKAPECGQFDGLVRTITGAKRCVMPKFKIKIKKDDGQWISITSVINLPSIWCGLED